ncbi:hypothetical protein GCM10009663_27350 [Kitasatospora arboriphila]|uniref:Mutator family transposase n=1 Tax=Kitasatospora arboriphila TaxID=258052 RepID=A0ABP4E0S9_9ACTN
MAAERDERGHRLVVRNGHHQPRTVVTAAGPVEVTAPRVDDRRVDEATGERKRFSSRILAPWCRKSPKISEVLPLLYLHGLSSGDFVPALEQFLGSSAGLSPATVTRLTRQWQDDHAAFQQRDLSDRDFVYVWADGVHPKVRLGQAHSCVLVLLGVRLDGTKELIALADGLRESTESWADLLRDCRRRGMRDPELVVGGGAMGLWKALGEVFPAARHQRCWVHKARNVTNALPKSAQPGATKAMQEIYNAEDRAHAEKAIEAFAKTYGTKWPKAVAKIAGDAEELLAFYDFPAEHWIHLRTTNPHRVHVLHGQAPDQGHPRRRQPGRGPGDGVQAGRVRPGPMARDHRRPPRPARPGRSPLRTRSAGRTRRAASRMTTKRLFG